MHFAAMIENLAWTGRPEFREAHVLLARDFFERIPERHLQPNRRTMAIDPKRSGLRFIVPLRLVSEQLAHKIPPDLFLSLFQTIYPAGAGHNVPVVESGEMAALPSPRPAKAPRLSLQSTSRHAHAGPPAPRTGRQPHRRRRSGRASGERGQGTGGK